MSILTNYDTKILISTIVIIYLNMVLNVKQTMEIVRKNPIFLGKLYFSPNIFLT